MNLMKHHTLWSTVLCALLLSCGPSSPPSDGGEQDAGVDAPPDTVIEPRTYECEGNVWTGEFALTGLSDDAVARSVAYELDDENVTIGLTGLDADGEPVGRVVDLIGEDVYVLESADGSESFRVELSFREREGSWATGMLTLSDGSGPQLRAVVSALFSRSEGALRSGSVELGFEVPASAVAPGVGNIRQDPDASKWRGVDLIYRGEMVEDRDALTEWFDAVSVQGPSSELIEVGVLMANLDVFERIGLHLQSCRRQQVDGLLTREQALGRTCALSQGCSTLDDRMTRVLTTMGNISTIAGLVVNVVSLVTGFVSTLANADFVETVLYLVDLYATAAFGVYDYVTGSAFQDLWAWIAGDPHLLTFDGLRFAYHGAGEYVALESPTDPGALIHVRTAPPIGSQGCSGVSVVQAAALRYGPHVIMVDASPDEPLFRVDGESVDDVEGRLSVGQGWSYAQSGTRLTLGWPNGRLVTVSKGVGALRVSVSLSPEDRGRVRGMWGNANGDPFDDLTTRDGVALEGTITTSDLYDDWGSSWRVRQDESLFTYGDGQDTSSFTDVTFPGVVTRLEDLDDEAFDEASKVCGLLEISPAWIPSCILDVACLKSTEAADVFVGIEDPVASVPTVREPPALSGDVALIEAPPSVLPGDFEFDRNIMVFEESEATLVDEMRVDRDGSPGRLGDTNAAVLSGGTSVRAFYVHFDPSVPSASSRRATITFAEPILGVVWSVELLELSDSRVGASGTLYPRGEARALELDTLDEVVISEDRRTLTVEVTEDGAFVDAIRVFTTPASMEVVP